MNTMKKNLEWLRVGGYVALVVVALPVLAALAFVGRGVVLAAAIVMVVAGVAAYVVSPSFRAWLERSTESELSYSGLTLGNGLAFHPFHAWARIEGDEATVGADDLVQATLGPVDQVVLPPVGTQVRQGDVLARLGRDARWVDLKAPVSGLVLATNTSLAWDPSQVNRSPFGGGWLARLQSDRLKTERKGLLRGESARAWFRREVDRLVSRMLPGEGAPALPDGGVLVGELYRQIDTDHWNRMTEEFFGGGARS